MKVTEKKSRGMEESRVRMIFMLEVDSIVPNPAQPRRFFTDDAILRLADSIRIHGIIQPLCVRKPDADTGVFELVAGERRLRAAKRIGMREVPCVMVEADSEESAHMAIVENIQREDLNMFEQAEAISTLMKVHCLTQEKIAQKLSCSQSYVANKLRLLRLDSNEREEILSAALSERHARALLRLKDSESRLAAMHTVIRREMNVAQTEEYIDRLLEAQNRISQEIHASYIGKTVEVFLDGPGRAAGYTLSGRTDGGRLVHTNGDESLRGTKVRVLVEKGSTYALFGSLVKD